MYNKRLIESNSQFIILRMMTGVGTIEERMAYYEQRIRFIESKIHIQGAEIEILRTQIEEQKARLENKEFQHVV
jgi:hypothetical protein